jgi:hypothetical protein
MSEPIQVEEHHAVPHSECCLMALLVVNFRLGLKWLQWKNTLAYRLTSTLEFASAAGGLFRPVLMSCPKPQILD